MQPNPDDAPAPRETAAGLSRGGQAPPPTSGSPVSGSTNPATQSDLTSGRSSADEQSPRAKSQSGKHVTADKWNQ